MASSPAGSDSYEFMWAPSPSMAPTVAAAATTATGTQQNAPKISPNLSPPLIAMVAIIGTALVIVLYARILSRHVRRLRRRWRRYRRRRRLLLSTSSGGFDSPPPNSNAFSFDPSTDYFFSPYGLDEHAIKSLPLSIFAVKSKATALTRDCAVCLLEFDDGDSLRTLPLCSHAFHVDCIDVWLRSHATCPLCRACVFHQDPLFVPMRAARIRPSLDDLIFDQPPDPAAPEPEITPASSPPLTAANRNFLLKRSYSFGFERNLASDRMVTEASTASPWRYRHRGSFWSKRWPSPFAGSSSASRTSRVFSFRSHLGFAVKSPFVKRRGFFPLSDSGGRFSGGAGPSSRRTRAMTSPSAIFMRTVVGRGSSSSRMRCGDPEALLSPEDPGGWTPILCSPSILKHHHIMSLLPTPPPSTLSPTPTPTTNSSSSPANLRPAVILPGLGNNTGDYKSLACTLNDKYGVPTVVARVSRLDWLRNAAGLLDPRYWKGTLQPRPVLDWYFERIVESISDAKSLSQQQDGRISLIGHSAGGWLARVYMEEFEASDHIALLLTLGSPHLPPPKGSPGVIDQTRGLLDYVEKNCAQAVYTAQLKYVCIAGRYIQGARLIGNSSSSMIDSVGESRGAAELVANNGENTPVSASPTLRARFVGQGYKQVCGQADVWGDGVVPEVSAHLEGALNISLDGIYHSPVGSDDVSRPWYGSPVVVEKWVHHLLT